MYSLNNVLLITLGMFMFGLVVSIYILCVMVLCVKNIFKYY